MECWKHCCVPVIPWDRPSLFARHKGVEVYNGKILIKKSLEKESVITISPLQLQWTARGMNLALDLAYIATVKMDSGARGLFSKNKTPKVTITTFIGCNKDPPVFPANADHEFSLAFTEAGIEPFFKSLEYFLKAKGWEHSKPFLDEKKRLDRSGIVGIERRLESDAVKNKEKISEAFQDINTLIESAKPMVQLMHKISNSIKDKQGGLTDDETIQFRQHLLSLGVRDPVTKSQFGAGSVYFSKLAVEISDILSQEVEDCGGMMSLVEAFCRVNRARGFDLASPEDLLDACSNLESQSLPIRLIELGDNVKVLQHITFDAEHCVASVLSLLEANEWLSPEEYARMCGIPCLLAKHSLVLSEERGLTCRDESMEGLRFYLSTLLYNEDDEEEEDKE